MELLHVLILSVIQGITEFLPISSSGHLILLPRLFNLPDQGLAFDAALHFSTALAIFVYFRNDWIRMLRKGRKSIMIRKILVASIPAVVVGLLFGDVIENTLRSPWVVVTMLVVVAAAMWWVESTFTEIKKVGDKQTVTVDWPEVLIMGFAQALALIPGTSRSGVTITAGMWRNVSREAAARFSFLLGAPITLGAGLMKLPDLINSTGTNWNLVGIGMITTFLVGLFSIHWLLRFLQHRTLKPFAIYRVVLAVVAIVVLLL